MGTPVSFFAAIFPQLGRIFMKLEDHRASYSLLSDKIQSLIDDHNKSFDGENPNNFIDHCLVRLENEKESGNNLSQEEEDEMFRTLIVDILIVSAIYSGKQQGVYTMFFFILNTLILILKGGNDTISSTLSFGILFLVAYPGVQKKVQEEIERVVGDGHPTLEDRKKMTYTQVT